MFIRLNATVQTLAAKNNTGPIKALFFECGFFRGDTLLSTGRQVAENVEAGQTVYVEVLTFDVPQADRTDCRVSEIIR